MDVGERETEVKNGEEEEEEEEDVYASGENALCVVDERCDYHFLAAIDCGTHSFRLAVVRSNPNGDFKTVDTAKEEVSLLSGSGGYPVITEERQEVAVAALKRLIKIARSHVASETFMRVVATSALRSARNGAMVRERLERETGARVEIIEGEEEGRLTYAGVIQDVPVEDKNVLLIDIGGGSTEIVAGHKDKVLASYSVKLGHLRLTEEFFASAAADADAEGIANVESILSDMRQKVAAYVFDMGIVEAVKAALQEHEMLLQTKSKTTATSNGANGTGKLHANGRNNKGQSMNGTSRNGAIDAAKPLVELAVGSSGTITTLHAIIVAMRRADGSDEPLAAASDDTCLETKEFTHDELRAAIGKLTEVYARSYPPVMKRVSESRSRSLLAGAVLLDELFSALGIETMRVSQNALREGVIEDFLGLVLPDTYKPSLDIRARGVRRVAQHFDSENRFESVKHVEGLAVQLIESLQRNTESGSPANALDDQCIELIRAACLLHCVGMFINHAGHHKHAYFVIKNAENLNGFSPGEIEVIARLVKYHRKRPPARKDIEDLPEKWVSKFKAMSAVVRMAIALDRRNAGAVASVSFLKEASLRDCHLVVDAADGMDIDNEMWCAMQELSVFNKVFDIDATICRGPLDNFGHVR